MSRSSHLAQRMPPSDEHDRASASQLRRHSHDNPLPAQRWQHQQAAAAERELEEGAAEALACALRGFGAATAGRQPAGMCACIC